MGPVRIGCLGAARITPAAVLKPAARSSDALVVAVAARDRARAQAFATRHGIPVVHDSYQALVQDDGIDAVYNPLPNSRHAEWTLRALEAGKHVLCEKPFTANAAEAVGVAQAAARTNLVVMEAFHWRYHPLADRMVDIVASGELGRPRHFEATVAFPLFKPGDIRWRLELAGGAFMDAGCYAVHMVRTLAADEPSVTRAAARLRSAGVDRLLQAELAFGGGRTGQVTASLWSSTLLKVEATVVGDRATLHVLNPLAPQIFHRLTVKGDQGRRHERIPGRPTYSYQLAAFTDAILRQQPIRTPPSDSVANMEVVDAAYRAAGLEPRHGAIG